jgi:carbon storage regulator CsrA
MLVLSRKCGERIEIGHNITVTVVKTDRNLVRLGIDAPRDVPIRRPEAAQRRSERHSAEPRPLRILVVDDSPEDRESYRRMIYSGGGEEFVVTETESGEEALQWCQSEVPDCILLDYRLPDLSGLEFLAELSGRSGQLPAPVVMLTGHGDEAIAVQAMKSGASDYLVKRTVTADRLRGAVQSAMQAGSHERPRRVLSSAG